MRRVLIHAFPARKPQALVLVDVAERALDTFVGDEIVRAVQKLAAYDLIASIDVRTLLRTLRFDPGNRRLAELGPPQRTRHDQQARADAQDHDGSAGAGLVRHQSPVRRRNEDAGVPRRRRTDEAATAARSRRQVAVRHLSIWTAAWHRAAALGIPGRAPPRSMGASRRGTCSTTSRIRAHRRGVPLEIVVGSAPGWADPWSRLRLAHVLKEPGGWRSWLFDDTGSAIREDEIQLARLADRG